MELAERVRRDIEAGDLGMARRRLASRLAQQGYDPDLLAELGRISGQMGDRREAGRFWVMSTAEGPEVDAAVRCFVASCGGRAAQVCSQLPRASRLQTLDQYPEVARHRWEELDVGPYVCPPLGSWVTFPHPSRGERAMSAGCCGLALLVVGLAVVCAVVGAVTLFDWIHPGLEQCP